MIVVVNKVDLFSDKSRMLPLLTRLNEMWPRADIFPTSALRRDGLPELKALIRSKLPEGPAQFPEDQISTASLRFMAAEIIREKLFLHLRQEVPYAVAVDVESWEEDEERGQTVIHAVIYVARPMHKAMVIRGGGRFHQTDRQRGPQGHPGAGGRQGASGTLGQGARALDGRSGLSARPGPYGGVAGMSTEDVLRERYTRVLERLDAACAAAGRGREDVALIAVSKLHPAADVAAVARAGQVDFGENYVQEALQKREELAGEPPAGTCAGI